jgi:ABC-2 type transport system permease protein
VMYTVITHGNFGSPVFAYMYLGNAFYVYVASIVMGVSWTVLEDRERYRTLKYMYVAPGPTWLYFLGRGGFGRFFTGSASVLVTLLFGVVFLKLPLHPAQVHWGLFSVTFLLGVVTLALMGLILAAESLLLVHHDGFFGDAVAAALYLFTGAVFPLDTLPAVLRPIGYALPLTYWLELLRRALVGPMQGVPRYLLRLSDLSLLGILAALTLALALVAALELKRCEHLARERGLIDRVSNY